MEIKRRKQIEHRLTRGKGTMGWMIFLLFSTWIVMGFLYADKIGMLFLIMGLVLGLFLVHGVMGPILHTLPEAKRLERQNELRRPIPVILILRPSIICGIILTATVLIVLTYFEEYFYYYLIGLLIALIAVIYPVERDCGFSDFEKNWGDYLKSKDLIKRYLTSGDHITIENPEILRETDKAIQVLYNEQRVLLPKSLIKVDYGESLRITIPEWLLQQNKF